jgi:hypothetical protein
MFGTACGGGFEVDVKKLGIGEPAKPYKHINAGIEVREPDSR